LASGQPAGWSGQSIHFDQPTSISPLRSATSSLTVAGFGFRTIGRLVWSINPLRSTTLINHLNEPLPSPTSITHFDHPLRPSTAINSPDQPPQSITPINHFQSDRAGPLGFRTIGRLQVIKSILPPSINPLQSGASSNHLGVTTSINPPRSPTSITHLDHPPRSTTSSLTVAGFSFRKIGRLVNQLTSINHPN
jgi:hypothetical protein